MYVIDTVEFGATKEHIIRNTESGESVVISELGANTRDLVLGKGTDALQIIRGYDTPEKLLEGTWARGIKMMPFPNRIENGEYSFGGRDLVLPINFPKQNHAIHGLLSKRTMDLVDTGTDDDSGWVTMGYDFSGKYDGYPFGLVVRVKTILSGEGLTVVNEAENVGEDPLPFGDGWHPYFKFGNRSDVDNWELEFSAKSKVEMGPRLIPTGEHTPIEGTEHDFSQLRQIGSITLDNVYSELQFIRGRTETQLRSPDLDRTITVWQDESYGYLVIFTPPDENRDCIAIEPMSCNTNAFNNGEGLTILEPGEKFKGRYGVSLA